MLNNRFVLGYALLFWYQLHQDVDPNPGSWDTRGD